MLTKIDSVVLYCWSDPSPIACNNALYPKQIQFLFQLILLESDPVSCELHINLIVVVSLEPNNWLPSVQLPSMKDSKRYLDNPNQTCGLSPDHIYHSLCFLYHLDIFGGFTFINKCLFHNFPLTIDFDELWRKLFINTSINVNNDVHVWCNRGMNDFNCNCNKYYAWQNVWNHLATWTSCVWREGQLSPKAVGWVSKLDIWSFFLWLLFTSAWVWLSAQFRTQSVRTFVREKI